MMPVIVKLALPGLESCAGNAVAEEPTFVLGKDRLAGLRTAWGAAGATPVPVNEAVCGDPLALSATATDAEYPPAASGKKVTVIVQLALAARDVPQLFVWTNLVALAPEMLTLVNVRALVPGFERVID